MLANHSITSCVQNKITQAEQWSEEVRILINLSGRETNWEN